MDLLENERQAITSTQKNHAIFNNKFEVEANTQLEKAMH